MTTSNKDITVSANEFDFVITAEDMKRVDARKEYAYTLIGAYAQLLYEFVLCGQRDYDKWNALKDQFYKSLLSGDSFINDEGETQYSRKPVEELIAIVEPLLKKGGFGEPEIKALYKRHLERQERYNSTLQSGSFEDRQGHQSDGGARATSPDYANSEEYQLNKLLEEEKNLENVINKLQDITQPSHRHLESLDKKTQRLVQIRKDIGELRKSAGHTNAL